MASRNFTIDQTQNATGQIVKNTSNNTTAVTDTSQMPGFIEYMFSDPITLVLVATVGLAIGIVGAIIYAYTKTDQEEESFEKDDLKDIVLPEMKKVVKKRGKKGGNNVYRDLVPEGEIYKIIRFSEKGDFKTDSDVDTPEIDISEIKDDIEDLYNRGIYSKKEKSMILDSKTIPHRLIMVRPNSTLKKISWFITDKLAGRDKKTEYKLIPEHYLKQNPDGSISIARSLQLRPFCGLQVPLFYESFGIVQSVVMRNLYKQSLEGQVNYFKKLNFFDSQFSQRVQKMEKEAEIEKAKYNSGVAGDVNNS